MRVRFLFRNIEAISFPFQTMPYIFDGSRNWVIAHNDVVAGSSPVPGSKCRGSSVVEHVNPQFILYPSFLLFAYASMGRRNRVIGHGGRVLTLQLQSALPDGAVARGRAIPVHSLPIHGVTVIMRAE